MSHFTDEVTQRHGCASLHTDTVTCSSGCSPRCTDTVTCRVKLLRLVNAIWKYFVDFKFVVSKLTLFVLKTVLIQYSSFIVH